MFVVSVNDEGQERNLVASCIRLEKDLIVIQAGGASHTFPVADLMDIIDVNADPAIAPISRHERGSRLN